MNKLVELFKQEKLFIPFITGGDPSLEISEQLILEMCKAGVNLIGVGIPFSDPVAGGFVIQEADLRALTGGATTDKIFKMLKSLKGITDVSFILMTYANPIFVYGAEKFMQNCSESGVLGIIVPDLPFEERDEFLSYCQRNQIALISTIALTSKNRIQMIAKEAEGFIYCVPSINMKVQEQELDFELKDIVKTVREMNDIPCVLDFDLITKEQGAKITEVFDGIIISSALVEIIGQHGEACVPFVLDYLNQVIR